MPVINLEKQNKDIKIKISVRMNGMVHRLWLVGMPVFGLSLHNFLSL